MPNSIAEKQNYPANLKLLQASLQAYSHAKKGDNVIGFFFLFLAIAYPFAYTYFNNEVVQAVLLGISFIVTLLVEIMYNNLHANTDLGSILKEAFDMAVLGLPIRKTSKLPDQMEVEILADAYVKKHVHDNKTKDWYPINLSDKVPDLVKIAVCQKMNVGWGIELRKKYSQLLIVTIIVYSILLLFFLLYKDVKTSTGFTISLAIAPFYTCFINQIRGHNTVVKKRKELSFLLDEIILREKQFDIYDLRDIQDEIGITRGELAKVPDLYFKMTRAKIEDTFQHNYIAEVNNHYAILTQ